MQNVSLAYKMHKTEPSSYFIKNIVMSKAGQYTVTQTKYGQRMAAGLACTQYQCYSDN